MDSQHSKTVKCTCPAGHKVRGPVALIGEMVDCPHCEIRFVFGAKSPDQVSVTDTGVMRILGDLPAPETSSAPMHAPATKPCSRCGVSIEESATVCKHCNTYMGRLPGFMKSLMKGGSFSEN